MLLSSSEIRAMIVELMDRSDVGCIQPASYDLRSSSDLRIGAKEHVLASTIEWVHLPLDIAGMIWLRSTWARAGLLFSGGWVDPGFNGNLTLSLFNGSNADIRIGVGERVAQLAFLKLKSESEGYSGIYQESEGRIGPKHRGLEWEQLETPAGSTPHAACSALSRI
jgi:dCTP deaminase